MVSPGSIGLSCAPQARFAPATSCGWDDVFAQTTVEPTGTYVTVGPKMHSFTATAVVDPVVAGGRLRSWKQGSPASAAGAATSATRPDAARTATAVARATRRRTIGDLLQ